MLKKLLQAFSGGLAIYSVLFLLQNLFVLSEVIIEKHAPIRLSLLFVSMFFPKILSMTFPFAVLFAALFVGSQASSNSELVAFTATGITPARQLRPYWLFSGLAAILYISLLFQFVPLSKLGRDNIFNEITRLSLTSAFSPGEFSKIGEDAYLMAKEKEADGSLKNVVLFNRLDDEKAMYSVEAAAHSWFAPTQNLKNSHILSLVMEEGNTYLFGRNEKRISALSYRLKTVSLNTEGFISAPDTDSVRYINRLPWLEFKKRLDSGNMRAWILLFKRLLLLLFVLFAPTLAYSMSYNLARGEGSSGAFVASFGIAFTFFIVTKLFEGFSLKMTALAPGLVLLITGVFIWIVYKHYARLTRIAPVPDKPENTYMKRFNTLRKRMISQGKKATSMIDHFQRGTLTGYIRLQFLRIFLSVLIAMEGIYLLSITLVNLPKFMELHIGIVPIVSFLFASLPPTFSYVFPFSFVLASLFYFSWMDSTSELVAVKALGVSVYKAAAPVLRLALILSVFMIFINTYLSPVFTGKSRAQRPQSIAGRQSNTSSPKDGVSHVIRSSTDPEISYYYEDYSERPMTPVSLEKLVAFKINPEAHRLEWAYITNRLGFGKNGEVSAEGEKLFNFYAAGNFKREQTASIVPDNADFFSLHRPEVDEMTSYQLRQFISEQKRVGIQPYRYITSYYDRFASAFSPLILLLIGLPFVFMGKGGRRKSTARGIAAGIILVVVYYAFASLFHSFGAAHYLPPFLAAWMINILFLLGGVFLFTEVRT